MKMDRELDEILGALRREHQAIVAPQSLEARLRAAANQQRETTPTRKPHLGWSWAFATMLLAAVVLTRGVWKMGGSRGPHVGSAGQLQTASASNQSASVLPVGSNSTPPALPVESAENTHPVSAPLRRTSVARASLHTTSATRTAGNSLQDFVPLPVSEGLPPAAELSVVRVKLQGSDLRQYGLEAPADAAVRTLLAEFVVGEDGLPRAIRIVQ